MWFFKKKEKTVKVVEKIKLKKYKWKTDPEKFDIGKTEVKISLEGKEFYTLVYGEYYQYISTEAQNRNDYVSDPSVTHSLLKAQWFIQALKGDTVSTFIDDPKNIKRSICGKPIAAEIIKTEKFEEEHKVAYLDEVEYEKLS